MPEQLAWVSIALQGRYALERELGQGGMATVFLARDLKHQRRVALKVLRPDLAAALGTERFLREIAIAARLSHPHILPLFDSGDAEGRLYYAMPYVEGETLRQRMDREPQLPVDEVIGIVTAVAGALDYAHREGVIHRDIKPENILLARDPAGGQGHPLVADFGIARALDVAGGERLTETGLALGTPSYMSPEQAAASSRLDGRSDVYALGCVAYEMLAGAPPFTGPTAQAILARHAVDPVPPLRTVRTTVPASVAQAIERALAKVPADRFATAGEFGDAVMAGADSLIDRAAHEIVTNRSAGWSEMDPVLNGFPKAQIALSQAVVRLAPQSEQATIHRHIIALSWVARGAWDSALAQLEQALTSRSDPRTQLQAYRLAALGVWVGALDVREARMRRPAGQIAVQLSLAERGEMAWLDGMVAVEEKDPGALAEARAALERSGDTTADVLDRSLGGAFEPRLSSGDRRAAERLAALEWRRAETGYAREGDRTFSVPVNRIAAADWLLASGDTVQAERLLHWNEANLSPESGIVFSGLVALQQARLEQSRGLKDDARRHYRDFLSRYDVPAPRHRHLVEEATAALRQLSDEAGAPGKQSR